MDGPGAGFRAGARALPCGIGRGGGRRRLPPGTGRGAAARPARGQGPADLSGLPIYDARLWALSGFTPANYTSQPLALELAYLRGFEAVDVAKRSMQQIHRSIPIAPAQEAAWTTEMLRVLPDVKKGDRIMGVYQPGVGVNFWFNGGGADDVHHIHNVHHAPRGRRWPRLHPPQRPGLWPARPAAGLRGPAAHVILPNHYAREFGVPLGLLGALLLGVRLFDAVIDPWLGRLSDALFARSTTAVLRFGAAAAVLLAVGFTLLFFLPAAVRHSTASLAAWAAALLVLTYAAFSALSIAHQSWAAMLGGDESQRSRIVAWREALGLVGVVMASVTPVALGLPATAVLFIVALLVGWLAWARAVRPLPRHPQAGAPFGAQSAPTLWRPFASRDFRCLLSVFLFNGIASAVPATLVLFFIQDRLQAPAGMEPLFLGSYFLSAALSIPLWLGLVRRLGLARSWLAGMLLSIATFAWASQLAAGQTHAFWLVCAVGADPGNRPGAAKRVAGRHRPGQRPSRPGRRRLLRLVGLHHQAQSRTGRGAGAAGAELVRLRAWRPLPAALDALVIAYCVLPCVLKAVSAAGLYWLIVRPASTPAPRPSAPCP